jgi:hypothetical protein
MHKIMCKILLVKTGVVEIMRNTNVISEKFNSVLKYRVLSENKINSNNNNNNNRVV